MPNWKKLIVSGSDANLNSLDVLASITGSTFLVNDTISIADGTAAAPSLRFTDDPDTGIYRSTDDSFNITVGGVNKFVVNSSGITSAANVYSGTSGQFRNYAGVWKATTGTTGNGFNFTSADLSDLLTISSTGDSVFKGDITINNTSSGNQLTIQSPVPDIQFIDSQATSRKARISAENGNLLFEADTDSGESNTGILFKMDGANALSFTTNKNAYFAADVSGSDVYINDWNSVSASLSTLTQNQTLNSGGTVDYVARFESADTITTGVIRDDGSTVGINAAPSANKTLYIDGTVQATGEAFFSHLDIIGSGGNSRIRDDIQFKFGTNRIFGIQYNSSGDYLEFTSGSSNLVTVKGNGSVGIGTTSPDRDLHVRASAIVSTKLEGTNAGHLLDLVNSNASPTYNGIRFTQGTTSKMAVTHIADGTTKGYVQIGNSWGAGSEILVVDGRTSRVGIGTTSPTAELQVAGDVIVDGTITAQEFHTEFVSASIIYESGSTKFGDTSEDIHSFSGSLRVTGSGDHYFTDGNVGIGTTTPIRTFHVEKATTYPGRFSYDSNNYLDIGYDSLNVKGGSLLFRNDGTEHLRINTTGALKAALYGSGNFTGTLAYTLGVDSSGNLIEFTGGSGGSVSSITNGADNRLAIFTGADSLEGDPNLTFDGTNFYVNGNIGIGTATPGEALEVVGNVEAEEFIGDLRGAVLFKAQAGEALSKGDVVYISGISGNTTVVSKADADDANKMPAFGVAAAAASLNTPIDIYTVGTLTGLDTSGFTIGDELYVSSSAGELTATAPTGESSLIQKIAKVTRVDNAAGSIKISGAGRTNATPNLNEGRLFVGNASNQAVADGTIHVDIANSKVGIGTSNPIYKLQIAGSTYVNNGTLFLDSNRSLMWGNSNQGIKAVNDSNLIFRTGGSEQMFLTAGGNVGIGTSNVSRINSTSTFFQPDEDGRFLVMNHNSGSFIMLETNAIGDGDQVGGIYFNKTGNQSDAHTHVAGIDAVLVDHATDALDGGELRFFTKVAGAGDTSHHMLLDAGGNFGIGQGIDPAVKLHVDAGSSDEVARFVSTDNKAYIRISDNDTTGYVSSENGVFSIGRNAGVNAANININGSHNVGIGTSTPGAKLDVHGRVDFANDFRLRGTDSAADQGVVRFYVNSNNELTIDTANNGNNLFVIDEGGQVGINTSSPSRTLDVNGEIQNNGIFRKGGNVIIKSTGSETMFGPGGSGIITFHNSATMTTSDETMRIDANGNLLLNNTSAGARLDIREDTNYAIRAEDASGHYFRVNTGGDVDMRGDLTVQGVITAQEFHTEFVSASIIYDSGSTKFGDTQDDDHDFTGSLNVSGSVHLTDNSTLKIGDASGGDLQLYHNGSHSLISNQTGNLYIRNQTNDGDIIFQGDDGSGGDTTYFTLDGSQTRTQFNQDVMLIGGNNYIQVDNSDNSLKFADSAFLKLGTGSDLQIYHDGTNSVLNNITGNLQIYNNADDGDIQFISDNGSGGNTEYFRVDGGATKTIVSKAFQFFDSVKAEFGDSSDLQIYHDGSNSYLNETGVGSLIVQASDLFLRAGGTNNTNNALRAVNGGTVTLFHANSAKLDTTSTGITVTGDIDADDITIDDWGSVSASLSAIQTAGGVNGTGTANTIPKWSDSDTLTDSYLTQPSATTLKLSSDGSATAGTILELHFPNNNTTDRCATINFTNNVGGYAAIEGGTTGANNTGYIGFKVDNAGTQSEPMRITGNGNVGIGTTAPAFKTTIYSDSTTDSFPLVVGQPNAANEFVGIGLSGFVASNGAVKAGLVLDRKNTYGVGDIHILNNTTTDNSNATLADSKFTILQNGNVGIGTTSPGTTLHVAGEISGSAIQVIGGSSTNKFYSTNTGAIAEFKPSDSRSGMQPIFLYRSSVTGTANYMLAQGSTTRFGVYDSGVPADVSGMISITPNNSSEAPNVKIGDAGSNGAYLDIGGNIKLLNDGSSYINGGNVGIGTSSPSDKLHVSDGSFRVQATTGNTRGVRITPNGEIQQVSTSADWLHLQRSHNGKVAIGVDSTADLHVYNDLLIDSAKISYQENTDVDSAAAETVATVAHASYDAAFFDYVVKNGTNLRAGTVMAVHDGTNVEYTDNSTKDIGTTAGVTFSVDISGTDLRLRATTTTDNWTIKTLVRSI